MTTKPNPMHPYVTHITSLKGKAKLEFLVADQGTLEFDNFVKHARVILDPMLSFHVKSIDDYVPPPVTLESIANHVIPNIDDAVAVLLDMNKSGSASAANKRKLSEIYFWLCVADRIVIDMYCARSLGCGVTATSLRKIIPGFLPKMPLAKCSAFSEEKIARNIKFPAYSQLKSDGARAVLIIDGNKLTFKSSNGRELFGLSHIFDDIINNDKCSFTGVLDGELVVLDADGNILPRKVGNGIISKAVEGSITPEEALRVRFIVWDFIDLKTWSSCSKGTVSYKEQLALLVYCVELIDSPYINLTETIIVNDLKAAKAHYRKLVARGEEGTILKDFSSVWLDGRSTKQFKFKEVITCEFKIVGWYYGDPKRKYKNCIGGFEIESECGKVKCNVGGGLSDEDRGFNIKSEEDLIKYANSFIDKIMDVSYNARIEAEGRDTFSLFLPRCADFRNDKDTGLTLEEIIEVENASRDLI